MEDVSPRVLHMLAIPSMADLPQPGRQFAGKWHLFSVRYLYLFLFRANLGGKFQRDPSRKQIQVALPLTGLGKDFFGKKWKNLFI